MLIIEPYVVETDYRLVETFLVSATAIDTTLKETCNLQLSNDEYTGILTLVSTYHWLTAKDMIHEVMGIDVDTENVRLLLDKIISYKTTSIPAVYTTCDIIPNGLQPIFLPKSLYIVDEATRYVGKNIKIELLVSVYYRRREGYN